jgi:cell wall-associated NlpC family hydrolase
MTQKTVAGIAAVIMVTLLGCAGVLSTLFGTGTTATAASCPTTTTSGSAAPEPDLPSNTPGDAPTAATATFPPIGRWDPTQVGYAATIIEAGDRLNIPTRGWVIAVAVAMQESGLTNPTTPTDNDSLGLFQQRPSQGWGTATQIGDPMHAATVFYQHLAGVAGWQAMALTDAAQAVQHSAYPGAYAKWEPDATELVTVITGTVALDPASACAMATELPADYTLPDDTPDTVVTAITWAFEQLATPYHLNGDCTASHTGNPAHQCDCSSLTQQAYQAAGILLPRTADEQSRHGHLIDRTQLQPGDLIFIPGAAPGSRTHPGHVGMYIGDNLIIEAPHTGQDVKIVPYTGDWITQQVAIRREVP